MIDDNIVQADANELDDDEISVLESAAQMSRASARQRVSADDHPVTRPRRSSS